ncbi:MAG: hypothetical protein FIA93_01580 [Deltaproteobacteria bacterium]|nr:hypothetical protein [Deltaproteobacteria bacterium]PWB61908.1 MAG: hypothetical protein C3F14_10990 [Deltaproteobacteria bacterium]
MITDNNAYDIAMDVYEAGDVSASLSLPLGPSTEGAPGGSTASSPRILSLVRTLQGVADDLQARQGASGGAALRTVVTESGTFDDGFGGSFSYTLSVDDQTGDFTGTFTFADFHGDAGMSMSGSMVASGNFDIAAGTFIRLRFSFPSLTITDGASSATASGSIDLWAGNPSTAIVNLYLADDFTGKTVWIDHFTFNVTEGAGFSDVTESGTIYLHDYGFVVVSTATPFTFATGSATPSSGVLVITGRSNGKVRLTAIDTTTCSIDVDADGDGVYESTYLYPWS